MPGGARQPPLGPAAEKALQELIRENPAVAHVLDEGVAHRVPVQRLLETGERRGDTQPTGPTTPGSPCAGANTTHHLSHPMDTTPNKAKENNDETRERGL